MFRIIVDSFKSGIITEDRPFAVRPPFGFPVIDFTRCTRCEECVRACPTGAIHTGSNTQGLRTLALSYAACIQCRECVAACPEQLISTARDIEVAAYSREQLDQAAAFEVNPATGHYTFRHLELQVG